MSQTVGDLVRKARMRLEAVGIDGANRDARLIVAHGLHIPIARLTLEMHEEVADADMARLEVLVTRRVAREPLSHILEERAFYNHVFRVTPDVLDPRPETEALVSAALDAPFQKVLDLGVGSGAILLSLLAARAEAQGTGADVSAAALKVAQQNAERLAVTEQCEFLQSDWLGAIRGEFDLIVSNPPYIALDEMSALAPELTHEPRIALTDESDGLSAYRIITRDALAHLVPGGRLMVEIGWRQGAEVKTLFVQSGYAAVEILPDLDGRDRVVVGEKPQNLGK